MESRAPAPVWLWRTVTGLVVLGLLLRIRRATDGRSLWGDEIALALNLCERSMTGLLAPLDYGQAAPPGYLWLTNAVASLVTPPDAALRLTSALLGGLALFLFARLALRLLAPGGALLAVAFLAVSEPHVHYSACVKQYVADVLMAVLVLERTHAWCSAPPERRPTRSLALAGVAAMLFSHAAPLLLGASGVAAWSALAREPWRARARRLLPLALPWLALFLILYWFVLRPAAGDAFLQAHWRGAFAPFPPRSGSDWAWYPARLFGYLGDPLFALPPILGGAAVLLGGFSGRQRRLALILCLGPLFLALVAAAARAYPFLPKVPLEAAKGATHWSGRLLLFSTPGIVLLLGRGVDLLVERGRRFGAGLGLTLACGLLAVPVQVAAVRALAPPRIQECAAAFQFVQEHGRTGDVCFVRGGTSFVPRYYARTRGHSHRFETLALFGEHDLDPDRAPPLDKEALRAMVERLDAGARAWIVHIDQPREDETRAEQGIPALLERHCDVALEFHTERAHVWCFERLSGRRKRPR